jgi:putative MATE family efflux protein
MGPHDDSAEGDGRDDGRQGRRRVSAAADTANPEAAANPRLQMILTGPVLTTMLKLGLPVIAVIMAQTAVAVTETYWIGQLGTEALAGASLVLPVFVLMATMSNGGIGGGVSSAMARAVGRGNRDEAEALMVHAIAIAVVFGAAFTAGALLAGPALYRAMGGENGALAAAVAYSAWTFGFSIPIWIVNLLSSSLRGAGEVKFPAVVTLAGAALLVPLSPVLIFGLGPVPRMEIAGAGVAVGLYYIGALAALVWHVTRGTGAIRLRPHRLKTAQFRDILGVGLISALGTLMASLTVVAATGAVGQYGAAALAGFGIAARLDSLLVPLLFGLGTAVVTMVGAATGAGMTARANHVSWTAAKLAFVATEAIGLTVALFPSLWIGLFSNDPAVHEVGAHYLRIVAPFYGAIGLGLILYFACQGRGRMMWPFIGGGLRLLITAGGAWAAAGADNGLTLIFIAVAAGSVAFGAINACGLWLARR